MTDSTSPAQYAENITDARGRLLSFVAKCNQEQWIATPLAGDPRPVGVIVSHVGHAYEYLTGWIRELLAGYPVDVNSDIVDELNAEHAAAGIADREDTAERLQVSGDELIELVAGLTPDQLELGEGRVGRLAMIAARHADDHRAEIEQALGGS